MIIADSAEVITATPGCYWQRSMGACSTTSDPACAPAPGSWSPGLRFFETPICR